MRPGPKRKQHREQVVIVPETPQRFTIIFCHCLGMELYDTHSPENDIDTGWLIQSRTLNQLNQSHYAIGTYNAL